MAVSIVGTSVEWGIPAEGKTAADSLVAGIVQDFEVTVGGNVNEITDEDGDYVTRVDHGEKNSVTFTSIVTDANATLPPKGDQVTFSTAIDGVALNNGECYVEDASITHQGTDTTTVSITVTHYPDMTTPP